MADIDYPSNSFKSKEAETEEVKKVTTGNVRTKEKSIGKRFAESFIRNDAKSVKDYVIFDVLLPAVKDMFSSAIQTAADMFIYGEKRNHGNTRTLGNRAGTNYNTVYRTVNGDNQTRAAGGDRYAVEDILFDTRPDADAVLDDLMAEIDRFGMVSAFKYYQFCGLSCDYTLKDWGWYDLQNASVVRTRDGDYTIKLPRIKALR